MPIATTVDTHATPFAVSEPLGDGPRHRSLFIRVYVALGLIAGLLWVAGNPPAATTENLIIAVSLAIAVLIGERASINIARGHLVITGDSIPLIVCAIIAPDVAVPMAFATVFLAPSPSFSVRLLGGTQVLVAVVVATMTASAVGTTSSNPGTFILTAALISAVFTAVSILQVLVYEKLVWRAAARTFLPLLAGSLVATTVFALPIICATAAAINALGPAAIPLVAIPLALVQYFHGLFQSKVTLTDELAAKAEVLARTNLQFAAAMVRALDTRDAYTAGHSAAVAVYTRDIAREMGFDDEVVRMAHLSGLLHDIGKIGVPGRVLNKTAPLDDEEYELMKSHAAMGADILGEVDLYSDIAVLVRYHHERIDGRGYPEGIAGEAIPAISRMISVADTYSAMTTDRPYRDGMPTEKAMSILRECRGTQLDSDFTDAFLRILIVADEAYQRGKQTDFEVEVAKHQAMSQVEAETVRLNEPHPVPAGPSAPDVPMLPAAVDGELVEVELEREAA